MNHCAACAWIRTYTPKGCRSRTEHVCHGVTGPQGYGYKTVSPSQRACDMFAPKVPEREEVPRAMPAFEVWL